MIYTLTLGALLAVPGPRPLAPVQPSLPAPELLVAQAPPPGNANIDYQERAKKGRFSFDFAKADIEDIVKAISDMTRRNFIIPENIKSRKITILSPTKINADEAYQVFLSALAANDITVVRSGKFYKLVPSKEAIKDTIPTCIGPEDTCPKFSEQMVTELIRLKYVDANTISPVLKGLLGKGSELTIFAPTNAMIVSDYAPNLQRVKRILEALDQPGYDDELQIVQIQHATAAEIADKLTQVFEIQAKTGAAARQAPARAPARGQPAPPPGAAQQDGGEAEVHISKIIPDDRTNQLIIKANRRSFEAIKRLISKLDVPVSGNEGVHVYYLENADAEDLASTLSSLATGQQQTGRRQPARGQRQNQQQAQTTESAVLFSGEVKVTADKGTNALIIMATRSDYAAMRSLIEKLDVPRRQVYIEAAILEVRVSDDDTYDLDYHLPFTNAGLGQDAASGSTFGFTQSATDGTSRTLMDLSNPANLLTAAGGSLVGVLGEPVSLLGGTVTLPSWGVILQWLQESSRANVVSTPHVLTSDNEEATIEVGQKIPFRRGTTIPTLPVGAGAAAGVNLNQFANAFSAIDRIDVSLKLTITPHINERDKIRLEIDQQFEDIAGEGVGGQPITSNRAAKTVVVVDDQQTVVLGGLMRDTVIEGETKIPILGDIPFLGWLFKDFTQRTEKINLLLVLTPYIVHDKRDFQRIFERKMDEYEQFAASYYGEQPKYRAHINYARKTGPLGKLTQTVIRELNKVENGGLGGEGQILITPSGPPRDGELDDEGIPVPRDRSGESGGATLGEEGSDFAPPPEPGNMDTPPPPAQDTAPVIEPEFTPEPPPPEEPE